MTARTRPKTTVSVVVPVRNAEAYLEECLRSVADQDLPADEIIVVDGHSVDRSGEIARSFDGVRFIPQVGPGLSSAYNNGVQAARCDLIAFHASDDIWTLDKLRVQVGYLDAHPEIDYAIARLVMFLQPGCSPPAGFREELLEGDHVGRILENLVVRRGVFERVGLFNPDVAISMDVDWFLRANDHQVPMTIIQEVLLRRRVHDSNNSLTETVNDKKFGSSVEFVGRTEAVEGRR